MDFFLCLIFSKFQMSSETRIKQNIHIHSTNIKTEKIFRIRNSNTPSVSSECFAFGQYMRDKVSVGSIQPQGEVVPPGAAGTEPARPQHCWC